MMAVGGLSEGFLRKVMAVVASDGHKRRVELVALARHRVRVNRRRRRRLGRRRLQRRQVVRRGLARVGGDDPFIIGGSATTPGRATVAAAAQKALNRRVYRRRREYSETSPVE